MVAMANSGPDTSGSQWYITLADGDQSLMSLDGGYTIFSRGVDGLDVVQAVHHAIRIIPMPAMVIASNQSQ